MLDRAMLSYLAHTPEVPDGVAAGALASAQRRHHLWLRAVQEILAEGPYRILDQLSGPETDQDTALGDEHDA
jgi:hypothetical protein